jgi:hypothetical protein
VAFKAGFTVLLIFGKWTKLIKPWFISDINFSSGGDIGYTISLNLKCPEFLVITI